MAKTPISRPPLARFPRLGSQRARAIEESYQQTHPTHAAELAIAETRAMSRAEVDAVTPTDRWNKAVARAEKSLQEVLSSLYSIKDNRYPSLTKTAQAYARLLEEYYRGASTLWQQSGTWKSADPQTSAYNQKDFGPAIEELLTRVNGLNIPERTPELKRLLSAELSKDDERPIADIVDTIANAIGIGKKAIRIILLCAQRRLQYKKKQREKIAEALKKLSPKIKTAAKVAALAAGAAMASQSFTAYVAGGLIGLAYTGISGLRESRAEKKKALLARAAKSEENKIQQYQREKNIHAQEKGLPPSLDTQKFSSDIDESGIPDGSGPGGSRRRRSSRSRFSGGGGGGSVNFSPMLDILSRHTGYLSGILSHTSRLKKIEENTAGPSEAERQFEDPRNRGIGTGTATREKDESEKSGLVGGIIDTVKSAINSPYFQAALGLLLFRTKGVQSLLKLASKLIPAGLAVRLGMGVAASSVAAKGIAGFGASAAARGASVGGAAVGGSLFKTGLGSAGRVAAAGTGISALLGIFDYYQRRKAGQTQLQSIVGSAAGALGSLGGIVGGGALAGPLGAVAGGAALGYGASSLADKLTGADTPPTSDFREQKQAEATLEATQDQTKALKNLRTDSEKVPSVLGQQLTTLNEDSKLFHGEYLALLKKIADGATVSAQEPPPLPSRNATATPMAGTPGSDSMDRVKYMMDFLTNDPELALPRTGAAGMVGNLQQESYADLRTGSVGDGGMAGGVAQWNGPRKAKFKELYGKDVEKASIQEQAVYLKWELLNKYKSVLKKLQAAKTADEAAQIASDEYFIPSIPEIANRKKNARNLLKTYPDSSAPPVVRPAKKPPTPMSEQSQTPNEQQTFRQNLDIKKAPAPSQPSGGTTVIHSPTTVSNNGGSGGGRSRELPSPTPRDPFIQRLQHGF